MIDERHKTVTIAELRARKGKMSQTELAKALGTNQSSISMWEKNIYSISMKYLERLCKFFGVRSTDITGF